MSTSQSHMVGLSNHVTPWHRSSALKSYGVKAALPFVTAGVSAYTHRVRTMQLISNGIKSWLACRCWCGSQIIVNGRVTRGRRHLWQLDKQPPEHGYVCATCEGRAIGAGLVGAREIAGRQVMFSPRGLK